MEPSRNLNHQWDEDIQEADASWVTVSKAAVSLAIGATDSQRDTWAPLGARPAQARRWWDAQDITGRGVEGLCSI